jgi:hypothetical protein
METTTTRWTVKHHSVGYALYFEGELVAITDADPFILCHIVATQSSDES